VPRDGSAPSVEADRPAGEEGLDGTLRSDAQDADSAESDLGGIDADLPDDVESADEPYRERAESHV
jgi:hypothetical protein